MRNWPVLEEAPGHVGTSKYVRGEIRRLRTSTGTVLGHADRLEPLSGYLTGLPVARMHQGHHAVALRPPACTIVELDVNQAETSPITLYDGPIESDLNTSLGLLDPPTRFYGQVWTGGPQFVIRYYEAHPPDGDKIPICAVARLARGQLKKKPESKPGTAILEFSSAGVYIVESFR